MVIGWRPILEKVRYDKSIYENQTFEAVTKGGYIES